VHGAGPTSASRSVSDIIDSHYQQQQQQQQAVSQHVPSMPTDNVCQPHRLVVTDSRQPLAVTQHAVHRRPPTKPQPPAAVMAADENDGNCLNLLHLSNAQHYMSAPRQQGNIVHGTTADIRNQQLRECAVLAGRSAQSSSVLHRADPRGGVSELDADGGKWLRFADGEHDWVCLQHAGALPHNLTAATDAVLKQPPCDLVSTAAATYVPSQTGQREIVTGRHHAHTVGTVVMLPAAGYQEAVTATSHKLHRSTALESTGQFFVLV